MGVRLCYGVETGINKLFPTQLSTRETRTETLLPLPLTMKKIITVGLILLSTSMLSAQSTVYSTTDFSGWFLGTKPTIAGGDLVTTASTTNAALTYFATPGNQYVISLGETLTLSANFTLASGSSVSSSRTFYLTLQNSNSTSSTNNQVTSNLAGSTANSAFANYTGYGLLLNPGPSNASAGQFDYRSGTNTNIVGSTTPWALSAGSAVVTYPTVGTPATSPTIPSGSFTLDSSHNYNITYTITATSATQMDFSYTMSNTTTSSTIFAATGSGTGLSGASYVTGFDTIAIGTTSAQTGSYKFFDVSLTSSLAPVPEPASYAMGFGLIVLAFAGYRRWAKARTA